MNNLNKREDNLYNMYGSLNDEIEHHTQGEIIYWSLCESRLDLLNELVDVLYHFCVSQETEKLYCLEMSFKQSKLLSGIIWRGMEQSTRRYWLGEEI